MVAGFEGTEGLKGNDLRKLLATKVTAGATIPLAEVFSDKAKSSPAKRDNRKPKHGKPDRGGVAPAPDDVAASFYHALGIDHKQEYHTTTGRPVMMIVRDGHVIPELFT